jgi:hypothetical protein
VWIAVPIAVAVVSAVGCDPEEWGASTHAPEDHQGALHEAKGGE